MRNSYDLQYARQEPLLKTTREGSFRKEIVISKIVTLDWRIYRSSDAMGLHRDLSKDSEAYVER